MTYCPLWFSWTASHPFWYQLHVWVETGMAQGSPCDRTLPSCPSSFRGHTLTNHSDWQFSPPVGEQTDTPGLLCPVWALWSYIDGTDESRKLNQLFLCYGGPRKGCALSKQHLPHWVAGAIHQAYHAAGQPCHLGLGAAQYRAFQHHGQL